MIYTLIILAVLAVLIISMYNSLVMAKQRTKEAWSTMETQLKRRYDLIPNLVETVKGYAKHESKTLEAVVAARNMAMNAHGATEKKAESENMLTGALKSVFALGESYPELKASTNFLELQQELSDTETKIQAARQFYNTTVLALNTKIQMFPGNIIAGMFHFQPEKFFELDDSERAAANTAPKVSF